MVYFLVSLLSCSNDAFLAKLSETLLGRKMSQNDNTENQVKFA